MQTTFARSWASLTICSFIHFIFRSWVCFAWLGFQGGSFDFIGVVRTCFGLGFWHLGLLVFGFWRLGFGRLGAWALGVWVLGVWASAFGLQCLGFSVWASAFGPVFGLLAFGLLALGLLAFGQATEFFALGCGIRQLPLSCWRWAVGGRLAFGFGRVGQRGWTAAFGNCR